MKMVAQTGGTRKVRNNVELRAKKSAYCYRDKSLATLSQKTDMSLPPDNEITA